MFYYRRTGKTRLVFREELLAKQRGLVASLFAVEYANNTLQGKE